MSTEKLPEVATPPGGKKGKKKSKKQQQTVTLNDFLSKTTAAPNWADATEDIDPADITTQWPDEHFQEKRSNFDRRVLPSAPRAATAAEIDMSRLPSKPPYTVYLGNLSYECSEEDVIQLFERKKLKAHSIRLPLESGTQRLRGFGYAEFDNINDLKEALLLKGEHLLNRPVHIDIADGKGGGSGGYDDHGRGGGDRRRLGSDDRTDSDWRRGNENELPINDRDFERRGSDDYYRERSYDRGGRSYSGRGSRYGSKWEGSREEWSGGYGGGYGSRDRYDDPYDRRRGEEYYRGPPRDNRMYYGGPRDDRYAGGFRDRPPRREYGDRYGGRDRDDGGRGGYRQNYDPPPMEPRERPRLQLQPRSKPLDDASDAESSVKSNAIFGGAKPVDTASKELEVEERLKKEEEEESQREKEKKMAVFGSAKPVDTAAREREIEEKMRREEEEFTQLAAEKRERQRRISEGEGESNRRESLRSQEDKRGVRRSRGDSQDRARRSRGDSQDRMRRSRGDSQGSGGRDSSRDRYDDRRHGQGRERRDGSSAERQDRGVDQRDQDKGYNRRDQDRYYEGHDQEKGYEHRYQDRDYDDQDRDNDHRDQVREYNRHYEDRGYDRQQDRGYRNRRLSDREYQDREYSHREARHDQDSDYGIDRNYDENEMGKEKMRYDDLPDQDSVFQENNLNESKVTSKENARKNSFETEGERDGLRLQDGERDGRDGAERGWKNKHVRDLDKRDKEERGGSRTRRERGTSSNDGGGSGRGRGYRPANQSRDYRRDDEYYDGRGRGKHGRRSDGGRGRGRGRGSQGDHGGGKRGEDRSRHVEGDRESEGSQRKGATSSNAWAKGKPSSLGGPQKPIILKRKVEEEAPNFSQPSRFATLQDQGDEEEHKKEDSEPTGSEVSNYITTES